MNIVLKSDFRDYYDHWFESPGMPADVFFTRSMSQGMSRPVMMEYLRDNMGLTTPRFGFAKDVCEDILLSDPDWRETNDVKARKHIENSLFIVVHLNPRAHVGEGKVLMPIADAMKQYPGEFAVEYIPATPSGVGISLRNLHIGHRQFWFRYSSSNDWRSNVGDVDIEYLHEEKQISIKGGLEERHPLFAIDFVATEDVMYAVDFNESPGLRGTGIEDVISGKNVYLEIEGCLFGGNP